jgi:ubiquinone biosynthesis protein
VPGVPAQLSPALQTLLDTGLRLARQAPTGRVALSRAADLIDPDAIPATLTASVANVFGGLPAPEPLDRRAVERALKDAWGRPPGKVLDDFDAEPLAVRAATQVHRGELNGAPVAVKILRPGLDRALRNDLSLVETLAVPLRAAFPAIDAGGILRDIREQAADETDLEFEAEMQRRVARAIRHVEQIVVPRAHTELAATGVLVSDLLAGPTLAEGGRPDDPAAAATALVQAHVTAARDAGLVLLDARPGHIVVLRDGRIGLLGAGVARQVSPARTVLGLDALAALRDDAPAALAAATEAAKLLPGDAARVAHASLRAIAEPLLTGPATVDAGALAVLTTRGGEHAPPLLRLAPEVAATADDLWIARGTGQLLGVIARLGAELDLARVALEAPAP